MLSTAVAQTAVELHDERRRASRFQGMLEISSFLLSERPLVPFGYARKHGGYFQQVRGRARSYK
jgi:hypothetical protein